MAEFDRLWLIVVAGILRDLSADVHSALGIAENRNFLATSLIQSLRNAVELQASVQVIKAAIPRAVGRHGANGIELYIAESAAFAVGVGHHWNVMPERQVHEFLAAERAYVSRPSVSDMGQKVDQRQLPKSRG